MSGKQGIFLIFYIPERFALTAGPTFTIMHREVKTPSFKEMVSETLQEMMKIQRLQWSKRVLCLVFAQLP